MQPTPSTSGQGIENPPAVAATTGTPSHLAQPSHARPPQSGGKPFARPHGKPQHYQHSRPKPKPKPLIPLTKAMKEGKEPLRTFGDLMQFYQSNAEPEPSKPATQTVTPPKAQ